jgi:Malectin domain
MLDAPLASTLKVVWRDDDPTVQVVYAVNVCGPKLTVNGTTFESDNTSYERDECAGYYSGPPEKTLDATYRENGRSFKYDIPVPTDGHYVLQLNFGKASPRPIDIYLNGMHQLMSTNNYFQIVDGQLMYKDQQSQVRDNRKIPLKFIPFASSEATIASILLVQGAVADLKAAKWLPDDACSASE